MLIQLPCLDWDSPLLDHFSLPCLIGQMNLTWLLSARSGCKFEFVMAVKV